MRAAVLRRTSESDNSVGWWNPKG